MGNGKVTGLVFQVLGQLVFLELVKLASQELDNGMVLQLDDPALDLWDEQYEVEQLDVQQQEVALGVLCQASVHSGMVFLLDYWEDVEVHVGILLVAMQ